MLSLMTVMMMMLLLFIEDLKSFSILYNGSESFRTVFIVNNYLKHGSAYPLLVLNGLVMCQNFLSASQCETIKVESCRWGYFQFQLTTLLQKLSR